MTQRHPIAPFLAACAGVAVFSVMDALMKGLSVEIGAYNALLWRSLLGSVIGAGAMVLTRNPWPRPAAMRLHLLRGIVVSFMVLLFFWGLARLPLAEAIALSFIAPLIALYLAALLLKERIGRNAIAASLLGLAGVAVILTGRIGGNHDPQALHGVAGVLTSAILFAYNIILQRQQAQLASPVEVAFFQNLIILGVLAPVAPFLAILPATGLFPALAGSALLAFGSLMLLSWAYARAEAQRLIPLEYTAFIWAAIMGWLMFAEPLTLPTLAGAALIVAGCFIAARGGTSHVPPVETAVL